ncbi:MFS transporter [uncultured Thermanaerothrix sp.]|uniref:MFS transporter n=1 Tax=uncultured Thermanaerothrix sp. TaxID=1195149 RepID=UPI0026276DB6|nr:MFS transporter [uncultured Thermanaerothrix sp.]
MRNLKWLLIVIGFVSLATWSGIRGSFAVFYRILSEELHWPARAAAAGQSLGLVTYAFLAPLIGWIIGRLGGMLVMVSGLVVLSAGLALCSFIRSPWEFSVFYGVLVGAGLMVISPVAYNIVVAQTFREHPGLAIGVTTSGMGLGMITVVPAVQWVSMLYGFRVAFLGLAAFILLCLLPTSVIVLRATFVGGKANKADSSGGTMVHSSGMSHKRLSLVQLMRTRRLWNALLVPAAVFFAIQFMLAYSLVVMVGSGVDPLKGAFLVGLSGLVAAAFRIPAGWCVDHFRKESIFTLGCGTLLLALVSMLLLERGGLHVREINLLSWCFAVLAGIGWGTIGPAFITTIAELFRKYNFGLFYGAAESMVGIGGSFGVWIGGLISDLSGTYLWGIAAAIIAVVTACALMWIAAPRKGAI